MQDPPNRDADPEDDLWFLPGPPESDDLPPGLAAPGLVRPGLVRPGPRRTRGLFEADAWRAAEQRLAQELAQLAMLFGALDARLRAAPVGWQQRLAQREAVDISWGAGDRIAADRLGLWLSLRAAGGQQDDQALARAGWAVRRLSGGGSLDPAHLAGFFGRQGVAGMPEATPESVTDMADLISGETASLHPVTAAALAYCGWRLLGPDGAVGETEAAVLAARLGAGMRRGHADRGAADPGGAVFMPLAAAGFAGVLGPGSVEIRLQSWIAAATRATLAALLHLDRLAAWQIRARAAVAGLQGRTPALVLQVLADWPMVSAPMAEAMTGAARASVQRNLARLTGAGLLREVTGQGRYRVWTATL